MRKVVNYPLSGIRKKADVNLQPLVEKAVPLSSMALFGTLAYRNSKEHKIRNAILSGLAGYLGGQLVNPYFTPISNAIAAANTIRDKEDRRD